MADRSNDTIVVLTEKYHVSVRIKRKIKPVSIGSIGIPPSVITNVCIKIRLAITIRDC